MKLSNNSQIIIGAAVLVFSFSLPFWAPTFTMQLATRGLYLGIIAMSFIWLAGYGDMVSLAQMSFAAMSGYIIGMGLTNWGMGHGVLAILGFLASIVLAAVFGWVAIRSQKIYFLVMTLALSQLFYGVGMQWVSVTGGQYGFTGLQRPVLFGYDLIEAVPLYILTLICTIACYIFLRRLVNSPFGYALQGIRDNPRRMAALGFDVQMHRYLAIVISGAIAGIAGILTVYYTGVVSPTRANLPQSVMVIMAALVGGINSLEGGILGGVIIAFLISITSQLTSRYWMIIGALFILIVMFLPNGLLGDNQKIRQSLDKLRKRGSKPENKAESSEI